MSYFVFGLRGTFGLGDGGLGGWLSRLGPEGLPGLLLGQFGIV